MTGKDRQCFEECWRSNRVEQGGSSWRNIWSEEESLSQMKEILESCVFVWVLPKAGLSQGLECKQFIEEIIPGNLMNILERKL